MKILFFGSSHFSLPVLEAILRSRHDVAVVITTPPKPKGRKRELMPSVVATFAKKKNLRVLEPTELKEAAEELRVLSAGIGVIASFGKIIPSAILQIPKHGIINVHPSLLPRWRGPSPIQSALLAGEKFTGVTIHATTNEVDAGDILGMREIPIWPEDTYLILGEKLAKLGGELVQEVLGQIEAGTLKPIPQDGAYATFSKKITTEDGKINWSSPAENIINQIRALNPEPGTFTFWNGKRLIIRKAKIEEENSTREPGSILKNDLGFKVAAKGGYIIPLEVQQEGKKPTDALSLLRGNPGLIGSRLL